MNAPASGTRTPTQSPTEVPEPTAPKSAKTIQAEELSERVREFLSSHPSDEYGPWAIVQALHLVPEGTTLSEADAKHGRPYDKVKAVCDRGVKEGVIRLAQPKPSRYAWAAKSKRTTKGAAA